MPIDGTTIVLISLGGGTFAAAFIAGVVKFAPKLWNGKTPSDPQLMPLPRKEVEVTYVRKDTCELERKNIHGTLVNLERDVRLLVRHFNVQRPEDEEV